MLPKEIHINFYFQKLSVIRTCNLSDAVKLISGLKIHNSSCAVDFCGQGSFAEQGCPEIKGNISGRKINIALHYSSPSNSILSHIIHTINIGMTPTIPQWKATTRRAAEIMIRQI